MRGYPQKRIVLLHSGECNSILLLHSWEIELSIRHHVTKINRLHHLNLTRYYINYSIESYTRKNLTISRQQVVFARLVTSCQQVWNKLLTT